MFRKRTGVSIRLDEIARRVNGELLGDGSVLITGICALEERLPGLLSLFTGQSRSALRTIVESQPPTAILVRADFAPLEEVATNYIRVKDPVNALIDLNELFFERIADWNGISPQAVIDPSAKIAANVSVAPFAVIGARALIEAGVTIYPHAVIYPDVHIGAGTTIHSGATIREQVTIGAQCIIQNGAVVGADGFGYRPSARGLRAVPQVGRVILAAGVEVGANTCIDRATLGATEIGEGTKLDNLVQVGHNVSIGSHSLVCGQVGIAGSARIGSQVVIGGGAGIADHVAVHDKIRIAALSGVSGDLKAPGDYGGYPAIEAGQWRRQIAALRLLPKVARLRNNAKK
jgi:UDP-3-O-[3-hydroxymyristoyl] glucosamine N-acyltransferase